jgi:hypothetical protein
MLHDFRLTRCKPLKYVMEQLMGVVLVIVDTGGGHAVWRAHQRCSGRRRQCRLGYIVCDTQTFQWFKNR